MAKQTITLKKYVDIANEYNAAEEITPGMLVNINSSGTVKKNDGAGVPCPKMFAVEDELQGGTIDTAFASGAPVQCYTFVSGEEVLARLANGQSVEIGDLLVSNGDGTLKEFTSDSTSTVVEDYAIAQALEAVDMSGSDGEDPENTIAVRIL